MPTSGLFLLQLILLLAFVNIIFSRLVLQRFESCTTYFLKTFMTKVFLVISGKKMMIQQKHNIRDIKFTHCSKKHALDALKQQEQSGTFARQTLLPTVFGHF